MGLRVGGNGEFELERVPVDSFEVVESFEPPKLAKLLTLRKTFLNDD